MLPRLVLVVSMAGVVAEVFMVVIDTSATPFDRPKLTIEDRRSDLIAAWAKYVSFAVSPIVLPDCVSSHTCCAVALDDLLLIQVVVQGAVMSFDFTHFETWGKKMLSHVRIVGMRCGLTVLCRWF